MSSVCSVCLLEWKVSSFMCIRVIGDVVEQSIIHIINVQMCVSSKKKPMLGCLAYTTQVVLTCMSHSTGVQ